jgi:hypothetical protein
MIKKILLAITVILLPLICCFLIYIQISKIKKTEYDFKLNSGKIEKIGITTRIHKGNYKSPTTESEVFYIKLYGNDTLYSYFNHDKKYNKLEKNIRINDDVKIFNEGFDEKQNTVDIVQLENNNRIVIDKSEFDKKQYIILSLSIIFLFLYFYLPYKFIYLKRNLKRNRV